MASKASSSSGSVAGSKDFAPPPRGNDASQEPEKNELQDLLAKAENHFKKCEYLTAIERWKQAYAIREVTLGLEHPDTARVLNALGNAHNKLGEDRRAVEYYVQALEIRRKTLGPKHPDTARTLSNLGCVHLKLAEFAKALDYHKEALSIVEK